MWAANLWTIPTNSAEPLWWCRHRQHQAACKRRTVLHRGGGDRDHPDQLRGGEERREVAFSIDEPDDGVVQSRFVTPGHRTHGRGQHQLLSCGEQAVDRFGRRVSPRHQPRRVGQDEHAGTRRHHNGAKQHRECLGGRRALSVIGTAGDQLGCCPGVVARRDRAVDGVVDDDVSMPGPLEFEQDGFHDGRLAGRRRASREENCVAQIPRHQHLRIRRQCDVQLAQPRRMLEAHRAVRPRVCALVAFRSSAEVGG